MVWGRGIYSQHLKMRGRKTRKGEGMKKGGAGGKKGVREGKKMESEKVCREG